MGQDELQESRKECKNKYEWAPIRIGESKGCNCRYCQKRRSLKSETKSTPLSPESAAKKRNDMIKAVKKLESIIRTTSLY